MKTPAKKTPANDARLAYGAKAADIARLMDVLQQELDRHAQAAQANDKCWGKVGDLGKVRSDLIDLVGFMSGMERAQVEAFLAE